MMDPMMNGTTEMMMTILLPAISEMIPPTKQPRMAVKAQHEAEMIVIFQWKRESEILQNQEVSSNVKLVSGSFCKLSTRMLL